MDILLTNDDGIHAPGLRALREALRALGNVTVVAPASEQSAVGHSITLAHPLVVQELADNAGGLFGYAVEGKPADCVKLAVTHLLPRRPDLVVSGVNAGSNAGINVLYSGTVAAAVEGAFFGITAIAVSLALPEDRHMPRAAALGVKVVRQILDQAPRPGELFNVNIPNLAAGDPLGVRVAEQGLAFYDEWYEARIDPRGRRYFWLKPDGLGPTGERDSDLAALADRRISVTPLHFDLTDRRRLAPMRDWAWEPLG
jgi:5'-nucleotidase